MSPKKDPLQVRRRDIVAERCAVEATELRDRECVRRQREAGVRVRELRTEPLPAREHDRAVVERQLRQLVDGMPARVARYRRVEIARDEAEICSRQLPAQGIALGVAARLELLEMGELLDVDLGGEMTPDRLLERLAGLELTARERPGSGEGLEGALPEQNVQAAVSYLEDNCDRGLRRGVCFRFGVVNHVDSRTGYRL